MKSLKESLFDKKGTISKKITTIGTKYRLVGVSVHSRTSLTTSIREIDSEYRWLFNTLKIDQMKKDVKHPVSIEQPSPSDIKKFKPLLETDYQPSLKFMKVIEYLVYIINNIPIDQNTSSTEDVFNGELQERTKSSIKPYLKNMAGDALYGRGGFYGFVGTSYSPDSLFFRLSRRDYDVYIIFEKV